MKQFGFVAVAALLSAILYFTVEPWLWALGSIIFFGGAIALAFVKIEGRPFINVIISAFNFYWRPQTYVWQPEHPKAHISEEKVKAEAGKSGLEDILARSSAKVRSASEEASRADRAFSRPARPLAERKSISEVPAKENVQAETIATKPISRETVSTGSALHKNWEDLQTGAPLAQKNSDRQFFDKKMAERYQIFQRLSGDRHAAKRIDYR